MTWSPSRKNWVFIGVYSTSGGSRLEPLEEDGTSSSDIREFTLTREICQLKRLQIWKRWSCGRRFKQFG
jgi:hypothetical protein